MITYSKATLADIPQIQKLLLESWLRTYVEVFSPLQIKLISSQWHSPELLTSQINDPLTIFLVAVENHQIVGVGNGSISSDGTILNIQRLHVDQNYQGQGIGSLLMAKMMASFPRAIKVELEVEEKNQNAIQFYQKIGFQKNGQTSFEESGIVIPCFVMEKNL